MIYTYVVMLEQEDEQETIGNNSISPHNELCMPLFKVTPRPLTQVCKRIRNEYLPQYFEMTCFRVYVETMVNSKVLNIFRPRPGNQSSVTDWVNLRRPAQNWLDRLQEVYDIRFRNVQFKLVSGGSVSIGASLNIAYNPKTRQYECEFVLDKVWNMPAHLDIRGQWLSVRVMPIHVWSLLKGASEMTNQKILDLDHLAFLIDQFDAFDLYRKVDPAFIQPPAPPLQDWRDETKYAG